MISFDQIEPISLKPIQGTGWAARKRPERLRATYSRKHRIRYIFGAPTSTATDSIAIAAADAMRGWSGPRAD